MAEADITGVNADAKKVKPIIRPGQLVVDFPDGTKFVAGSIDKPLDQDLQCQFSTKTQRSEDPHVHFSLRFKRAASQEVRYFADYVTIQCKFYFGKVKVVFGPVQEAGLVKRAEQDSNGDPAFLQALHRGQLYVIDFVTENDSDVMITGYHKKAELVKHLLAIKYAQAGNISQSKQIKLYMRAFGNLHDGLTACFERMQEFKDPLAPYRKISGNGGVQWGNMVVLDKLDEVVEFVPPTHFRDMTHFNPMHGYAQGFETAYLKSAADALRNVRVPMSVVKVKEASNEY